EDVRERPDRQRVDEGADADSSAEHPAAGEGTKLERGAYDADRMATRRQPRHQPVTRPGTEPRPDVRACCDAVQPDPGEQEDGSKREPVRSGNRRHAEVDHGADHDDVAERAETGALTQRNPESEHHRADDDCPGADSEAEPPREALVEHIPGIDPEPGEQHKRIAEAVEHQAGVELSEAPRTRRRDPPTDLADDHSFTLPHEEPDGLGVPPRSL